jgi:hypothetical protein
LFVKRVDTSAEAVKKIENQGKPISKPVTN